RAEDLQRLARTARRELRLAPLTPEPRLRKAQAGTDDRIVDALAGGERLREQRLGFPELAAVGERIAEQAGEADFVRPVACLPEPPQRPLERQRRPLELAEL